MIQKLQDLDLIGTAEAAELLGVTTRHVRYLATWGVLPCNAVHGRGRVFLRADVLAWRERRPPRGRPPKQNPNKSLDSV